MLSKPLCVDLFCGLGGWAEGFLAKGYDVVGFDIERHQYGDQKYPAQLVIQDVLTLNGRQFRHAVCIVASPPCQEFSYMAMPWQRGKQIAAALRWECEFPEGYNGSTTTDELTALFDACFRIQREASEAAGHHIPMVVENVKGAQPWVGMAKAHYGSFYLWGDIDTVNGAIVCGKHRFGCETLVMLGRTAKVPGENWSRFAECGEVSAHWQMKVPGMNFHDFDNTGQPERSFQSAVVKTVGHVNKRDGHTHTRHLTNQGESDAVKRMSGLRGMSHPTDAHPRDLGGPNDPRRFNSHSTARKAASAMIAKIPYPLANYVARQLKLVGGMSDAQ
jgi:hypothetical protein